jgi:hypothetical protein
MPSSYPKLTRLLERITEGTEKGQLNWKSSTETAFSLPLEHGAITIASRDADGIAPYDVNIFNAENVAVESIASEDDPLMSIKLDRLYQEVRRQVMGVNSTLDALLGDVGDPDIPF